MAKGLVEQLNNMYDSKYYTDCEGKCKWFDKCNIGIVDPVKYYSDRVKIGEHYGEDFKGTPIPKIVFCGLEGVHKGLSYQRIPSIDLAEEISKPSLAATNNHYRGVRYVLAYILSGFLNREKPENAYVATLNKCEYTEMLRYYCLTNIYRCAFGNKTSGLPHTGEMQTNCPKILFDEMDNLRPDLIVFQVVTGRPPHLWEDIKYKYHFSNEQWIQTKRKNNTNTALYRLYYEDGTPFYCLWTYHGNGSPYYHEARFVNNDKYIYEELNPILDETINQLRNIF